jgi:Tfp pilus assembly protein PilP
MKRLLFALCFGAAALVAPQSAGGQPPAPTPAAPAPAPVDSAPTPPPNYIYSPDGRRDPFVSLINRGLESRPGVDRGARPDGLAGLMVDEVVVRGIVQTPRGFVAMVGSPTGKTYSLRVGDRLMDGSVRAVTAQAVILLQDVNDPLSLEKQREVRKYLRGEVK